VLFQNFIVGLNDYYNSASKRALRGKETGPAIIIIFAVWSLGDITYRLATGLKAVIFNSLLMRFPQDISWSVDLWPRKIFLPSLENSECHHSTDYKASKNKQNCAGIGLHFLITHSNLLLTSAHLTSCIVHKLARAQEPFWGEFDWLVPSFSRRRLAKVACGIAANVSFISRHET